MELLLSKRPQRLHRPQCPAVGREALLAEQPIPSASVAPQSSPFQYPEAILPTWPAKISSF